MEKTEKEKRKLFLQNGYADWIVQQRRKGKKFGDMSQREFCDTLDIPDTDFSRWLKGSPPNTPNLDRLAVWYGPEIYTVFGISERMPKDALLRDIARKWHRLSEERRRYYLEQILREVEEEEKKQAGQDHPDQQMSLT
jgi:hypothetical protein